MTEQRHLDLVDRLRGQYHLPVNDGAGPLNGSMTFSREFPVPPIQKQAADEIERLRNILLGIAMMDALTREGEEPAHELMRRMAKEALQ